MTSVASSADAGEMRSLAVQKSAAGIVNYWTMLWAQSASSAQMVRAAGVEPAQRLRTEGF